MMNERNSVMVELNDDTLEAVAGGIFRETDQNGNPLSDERIKLRKKIRKDVRDRTIEEILDNIDFLDLLKLIPFFA